MTAADVALQGFGRAETVTIDVKRWHAMRRQMLRLVTGWRYGQKESARILDACRHTEGCPAIADRAVSCLPSCPDREIFLSALLIHHNAQQYAMYQKGLPFRLEGEYRPPPREYFDAIVSELEVLRQGRDILDEICAAADGAPVKVPWEDAGFLGTSGQTIEQPMTRLLPPEPEDDVEPTTDAEADEDYVVSDTLPPEMPVEGGNSEPDGGGSA